MSLLKHLRNNNIHALTQGLISRNCSSLPSSVRVTNLVQAIVRIRVETFGSGLVSPLVEQSLC